MNIRLDEKLLLSVQKPARYTGNELNMVVKNLEKVDIRFAFCFPDVYEVGMSHLGMKILYHLLNKQEGIYCERVFAPWTDMEEKIRENNIPLFALETHDAVEDFDFVGFTLQYEMSYTNVLNMLDLARIPLKSNERTLKHPFVCAGGPCVYNPEPLADIIDFFVIGEGEEVILEIMEKYREWKKENASREEFLNSIATLEGIYVPSKYEVNYNADGTLSEFKSKNSVFRSKIKKRFIKDFDNAFSLEELVVPYMGIVHDRVMLELFRGCIRGCRFCQAGFIYRPVREKTFEKLLEQAKKLINSTGYEEISLASLSTSDYTMLEELCENLVNEMEPKKVNLALPSLRIDSFSLKLLEKVQRVRKSGLTFAPEAGTQRLRNIINKGLTEEDILNSASLAFENGMDAVKLYFMIGLPGETFEDLQGIRDLCDKIIDVFMAVPKEKRGKRLTITVSTSSFVPKPFTPFQWEAQDTEEVLVEKQRFLRDKLKSKFINYSWHDPKLSFLEAVFARGDRRLTDALIKAWSKGCKFDAWGEYFNYSLWMEAFDEAGIDPGFYATRKREVDELLPWEHIDIGVTRAFLERERERAYKAELTPNCRKACAGCGIGEC